MWDIDTIDWKPTADGGPTALDIEAKVLSRVAGRLDRPHAPRRLEHAEPRCRPIVDGLRKKGLEPVTLAEMFIR